uniref:Uncharacterized protein n=1 Tax=Cryptomonas curvata TaxID=233186 RepID=A0A7S0QGB5_9CRYP
MSLTGVLGANLPASVPIKTEYVIGGWIPGDSKLFLKKWRPVLETYLTDSVGPLYDPPISFKLVDVDYSEDSTSQNRIKAGQVDFVYNTPGVLGCIEASYGFTPIATQRQLVGGKESGAIGSLVYSKKDGVIKQLKDVHGRRVAVGQISTVGAYQLGFQLLLDYDINIYAHAEQVIFYQGDFARQMNAVLSGEADIGFLLTGWIEANFPQNIPLLEILEAKQIEYQSERYPFLTSTELVPSFGLSTAPQTPWTLQQNVLSALSALNATHPAAQSAGISTFTLAASHELARKISQSVGFIIKDESGTGSHCLSPFQAVHGIITCPHGYMKQTDEEIDSGCARKGLPCPTGLVCVCRPCVPAPPVNVFPWQVVLGLCAAIFTAGLLLRLGWGGEWVDDEDLEVSYEPSRRPPSRKRSWKA